MTSEQLKIDYSYLDRKGIIDGADLPKGKGKQGQGVSPAMMALVLHRINDHLGSNTSAWPSQTRVAELTKVSVRSVIRATQAMETLGIIIIDRVEKSNGGFKNYYRIVWEELHLLGRRTTRKHGDTTSPSHSDMVSRHSDMVSRHSDMVSRHSDMVSRHSDMVSPEQLTNNSRINQRTHSPLKPPNRVERRDASIPSEWVVVVSLLSLMGVSASERAVTAARARELTPDDVRTLANMLEPYKKYTNPRATPGFLYRWITGESEPPTAAECGPTQAKLREQSVRQLQRIRFMVVRAGRKRAMSDGEIEVELRKKLVADGYPPDAITLNEEPKTLAKMELTK